MKVYGYAGFNPQNNIDPSGLFINSRDAAIAGGANALALAGENALGAMAYFGSAAAAGAGAALICEMSSDSGEEDEGSGEDGPAVSDTPPPAPPLPTPPDPSTWVPSTESPSARPGLPDGKGPPDPDPSGTTSKALFVTIKIIQLINKIFGGG